MQFEENYFEDEVRTGFYVPSIMKRVWAEHIVMLEQIDYACKQLGIRWFAANGTLLGAVRHGGFIPWDDDVDIRMLRHDYEIFISEAGKYLPKEYFIRTIYSDPEHTANIIRVDNTLKADLNAEYLNNHHGSFYAAGVDIFPMDYLPSSQEVRNEFSGKLHLLNEIWVRANKSHKLVTNEDIRNIQKTFGIMLKKDRYIANGIAKLQDKITKELCGTDIQAEEACDGFIRAVYYPESKKKFEKKWFAHITYLNFEGLSIPCPAEYDEALSANYGDYKNPVRGGSRHDYPYFKDTQRNIWRVAPELKFTPTNRAGFLSNSKINPELIADNQKRTAVLMPVTDNDMNYLEPIYKRLSENDWSVYIIPMPYLKRKYDRGYGEVLWDGEEIGKRFPVTRFDAFDFGNPRPDIIFFTDPYDQYNGAHSIHPFFYSDNIRNFTDYLVYVPTFEVDVPEKEDAIFNWTTEYFVKMPGVYAADRIEAPNEKMDEMYRRFI